MLGWLVRPFDSCGGVIEWRQTWVVSTLRDDGVGGRACFFQLDTFAVPHSTLRRGFMLRRRCSAVTGPWGRFALCVGWCPLCASLQCKFISWLGAQHDGMGKIEDEDALWLQDKDDVDILAKHGQLRRFNLEVQMRGFYPSAGQPIRGDRHWFGGWVVLSGSSSSRGQSRRGR